MHSINVHGESVDYRIIIEWDQIRISQGDIIFRNRVSVIVLTEEAEDQALEKAYT